MGLFKKKEKIVNSGNLDKFREIYLKTEQGKIFSVYKEKTELNWELFEKMASELSYEHGCMLLQTYEDTTFNYANVLRL